MSAPVRDARKYEFFRLVQQLTRMKTDAAMPGGPGPAARENVRFRPSTSLGFAATDVEEVTPLHGERHQVTVNFMGLYGPSSPMPNHFSEEILWAGSDGDAVREFLDVFHHRIISLFYRAWEKYRYAERFSDAGPDEITRRMLALLGLGTPGMAKAAGVPLPPLLRTAGMLASRRRSAVGLERFLACHLVGIEVKVEPCVARRARIRPEDRTRLGRARARLGVDTLLGDSISDRGGTFRIVLGPMHGTEYRGLLPGGKELERLVRLARLYVRSPLAFDVELELRAEDVPALKLDPTAGLGLGYMTWLAPRGAEDGHARFTVHRVDPLS